MKRLIVASLIALILLLQYHLWFGDGGLVKLWQLSDSVETQKKENAQLTERNQALEAEVRDLKHGLEAIEERARTELGMVKKDETFFQVLDEPGSAKKQGQQADPVPAPPAPSPKAAK